ncbi:MAG: hypothetical protein H6Q15_1766 [Bacteroidetes bacterium]|nr:hypothetical protein [Bacteroidota bacterium]
MFVIPKSKVTIGKVSFHGINSGINAIEIFQSVKELSSTAKITIPLNYKSKENKGVLDYIKVGDKTSIALGYNDSINTEFTGYVTSISATTPLVIEVDDDWYLFKKTKQINKSWKKTTLKEVLTFCFKGYTIDCPNIDLTGGFIINNTTPYEAIKGLKESYGFFTKLDEKNKKIRCFWGYDFDGFSKHTYVFGTRDADKLKSLFQRGLSPNVAKSNLTFTKEDDIKLHITAKAKQRTGKEIKVTIGSKDNNATKRTLTFGSEITTEKALKEKAEQELKRLSFNGYRGTIIGYGHPQTQAGDNILIVDVDNKEREGEYLIESVKIEYSVSNGFRRTNTLSYKIR